MLQLGVGCADVNAPGSSLPADVISPPSPDELNYLIEHLEHVRHRLSRLGPFSMVLGPGAYFTNIVKSS